MHLLEIFLYIYMYKHRLNENYKPKQTLNWVLYAEELDTQTEEIQ